MTKRSLVRRLKALAVALRPLEREAEAITDSFDGLLSGLEDRARRKNRGQVRLAPTEAKRADELGRLYGLADVVRDALRLIRREGLGNELKRLTGG